MAVDEVQIGMAQPAGLGVDQDFMRAGRGIGDFGDAKALARGFEDCGFCHDQVFPFGSSAFENRSCLRVSTTLDTNGFALLA
jgi:hypothetical protein